MGLLFEGGYVEGKRKRDIFGFACNPPRPCPLCKELTELFERTEDEKGKAVFVCSNCMDGLIEEMEKQITRMLKGEANGAS